jgi:hypothetical protein
MDYLSSYKERNSGEDMADKAMLRHLEMNDCVEYRDYLRIGTDPKENKLDLFWFATKILLVPDYILVRHGFIYFIEVKGTNKLKAEDYYKIQEMAFKGSRFKEVKVGIMYFAHPEADPVWIDHKKLFEYWIDPRIETKYYPELDFQGNKKPYKEIPV